MIPGTQAELLRPVSGGPEGAPVADAAPLIGLLPAHILPVIKELLVDVEVRDVNFCQFLKVWHLAFACICIARNACSISGYQRGNYVANCQYRLRTGLQFDAIGLQSVDEPLIACYVISFF